MDRSPVPHGFALPNDEHRLLRGRPPAQALAWAASSLGAGARVASVRALPGGTSSALHVVTFDTADGRPPRRLVLRRHVRADLLAEEPDIAAREAEVLQLLEASAVPAPRLIAVDAGGDGAGSPAVLMTLVPGRIEWAPHDLDAFIRRLADPLPAIHSVAVPPAANIPRYRPYELGRELGPPVWTRFPAAWRTAIELYTTPPPTDERLFIHRDYHPGNVMWSRGRVTAVVDWASASLGSPEADVGHCRANLVDHLGAEAADRFLAAWQSLSGRTEYDPYWDIAVVVAPTSSYGPPDEALDHWVARAVAQLTPSPRTPR